VGVSRLGRRRAAAVGGGVTLLAALAIAALAAGQEAPAAAADGLTAAAARGRVLYRTGTSASGDEVLAVLGDGAVEVPASSLPCGSCHGQDGRGRAEGGVRPSDLTWPALTRPYEVEEGARRRGPYDEAKLIRAITLGVDSSGNRLDTVMPRYRLSKRDADDLVAYLRQLGRDPDPGVSDAAVRLGVLLPPAAEGGGAAASVRATLDAVAASVNGIGGVYQRRLDLAYHELPADPAARAASAGDFVERERPFALVAPSLFGAEAELAALAAERELPVVGPLALAPPLPNVPQRWVFYLDPGMTGLARVLMRQAQAAAGGGTAVVISVRGEPLAPALVAAALAEAQRLGWQEPTHVEIGGEAGSTGGSFAAALAERGIDAAIVLAGGGTAAQLVAGAREAGWRPTVLALGPLASGPLLAHAEGFGGRILLAFPTLPQDRTAQGVAALRRALAGGGDGVAPAAEAAAAARVGATEVAAYAAMDLLVEGLRRTGRDLSRLALIETLEGLRDHRTGLLPPLSYGPNRRLGTGGAWIVELDPAAPGGFKGATWVELVR
jgi:ABC-type branched-subunit amino acid transport system substrate-binding protein